MNKIVEYMAMSRPIVSFDLTEARVSAGDAAVYAAPNDELEFARLVHELLESPNRRQEMSRIGRERVENSLSWAVSRLKLLEAYEGALSKRPNGRRRRPVGQVQPQGSPIPNDINNSSDCQRVD